MFVTLVIYAVGTGSVRAHEYAGDCCLYVGEVTLPRRCLPQARPGERIRVLVA
jgi:hypothetical protein